MVVDGNELMPKVLAMFRRGYDTAAIGNVLMVSESAIERVLHAAMSGDRMSSYLLHQSRMERERGYGEEDDDQEGDQEDRH